MWSARAPHLGARGFELRKDRVEARIILRSGAGESLDDV